MLVDVCRGKKGNRIPIWFMRQAGRYLPEYREVRANFSSFVDFCLTPKAASKVTVQPLKRFDLDGAIIFADILLILVAMGLKVEFKKGYGPIVENGEKQLTNVKIERDVFKKVAETASITKNILSKEHNHVSLIGFAGSPWTVACYLFEGGSSKDFAAAKRTMYSSPKLFDLAIDLLTEHTIEYLEMQIEAGVDIIKLFDSWSGILDEESFRKYVIRPTQKIVRAIKEKYPNVPIIGFCRHAGVLYEEYVGQTDVDVVATDQFLPLDWIASNLQPRCVVQGNLDNILLASNADLAKETTQQILNKLSINKPFIFNLGHGIVPETPIENVQKIIKAVRDFEKCNNS